MNNFKKIPLTHFFRKNRDKIQAGIIITMIVLCASVFAAAPINPSFETGDLTGWTKTGTAWDDSPETTNYWPGVQLGFGCEGTYFALSRRSPFTAPDAETATGTLRSSTFSIPEDQVLSFLICGHSKQPGDPSNSYNYVSIKRVSDDAEIERFWTLNGDAMIKNTFVPPTNLYGVELYIEVVDDCSLGSYAWLGVDDFKVGEVIPPDPRNWNFETGTYTNWPSFSGTAFSGKPTTKPFASLTTWEGVYYANSVFPDGENQNESAVGVMRSDTFTFPTNYALSFLIAGHSTHWSPETFNYVTLKLASDDSELDRVWAPNQDPMVSGALGVEAAYGKDVYIEVVDDCSSSGWAWIAVDDFKFVDSRNFDFENGYVGWDVTGAAWGSGPVTTNYRPNNPIHGEYYATSIIDGEANTGTIRSITFTYPADGYVKFLVGGHSDHWLPTLYNYVVLKDAATHTEYGKVYAPNQDLVVERAITNASAYNKQVYIEVVDNCTSSGFAWISVDYFQIKTFVPEPPEDVSATDGTYSAGVQITWTPSLEVNKYAVFRADVAETNLAVDISGDISVDSNEYFDTTGLDNSNYYYWVKAGNTYGWSEFGDYDIGFRSTSNPPDKPVNQLPADGSLQNFPIVLSASEYNDANGWPFEESKWQLSSDAAFISTREFQAGPTNVVNALSGLIFTGTNYWRVSYQSDRNKWSDWSDSTTFIVSRDVNSPYYFNDTFNNISGSGDVNNEYYAVNRQHGTAAPLDYSISGITEVGQSATTPNKLTLNGVASCSPNYSFVDYTNFVIEFDVLPANSSWTGISFGKIAQNAFPVSPGGIGIVFFGAGASAPGLYQVFSSGTLIGSLSGAPNHTNMHVKIAVAAESFDNDTTYISMFINGKPIPLRQAAFDDGNPTNDHQMYYYVYERTSGFDENYITLYNNGDVGIIDNFKVLPCSAQMTTRTWESDADMWIGTSNPVAEFTHAVNLNWDTEINVDGLPFEAPGEINILQTNDLVSELHGSDWFVFGADSNISAGQFEFESAPLPTGTGADIAEYFLYGWGSSIGITLSNLTSGSSNIFTIYGRPFGNTTPRQSYISGSDGGIFLVDENGIPDKCQIISYDYLAGADGTFTLTFTPQPNQDYILYGFSSVETGVPEPFLFIIYYFGLWIIYSRRPLGPESSLSL